MKNTFLAILSKPRTVIPATFVLALVIGFVVIPRVGNAPHVAPMGDQTLATSINTSTVSLAFNASGRVMAVSVTEGDTVKKGQVLASLDTKIATGAVDQAKGALDLAKAQSGSLSVQYQNAQTQQDTLVSNAYHALLSSGLQAIPYGTTDETHNPVISGTYTCDTEGAYQVIPYGSGGDSGYSFDAHGLEEGSGAVTFGTPQPLGKCGLLITFVKGFSGGAKWTVSIPNTNASSYQTNKNAYDLAVSTRTQVLSQLSANLGQNGSTSADVSGASITAAEGTYEMALAQFQNNIITAPEDGVVSFVDAGLKVGQSVTSGHPVITITPH